MRRIVGLIVAVLLVVAACTPGRQGTGQPNTVVPDISPSPSHAIETPSGTSLTLPTPTFEIGRPTQSIEIPPPIR